jgi:hypothetical protein
VVSRIYAVRSTSLLLLLTYKGETRQRPRTLACMIYFLSRHEHSTSADEDNPVVYQSPYLIHVYHPFWLWCSHERFPLLVECPLVFQPLSISLDAGDLLAVEIWDWVCHGGSRGVDSVSFDAAIEFFFLLLRWSDVSTRI